MPTKIVAGEWKGKPVEAINTWFNGATLKFDGKIVATNHDYFALRVAAPLMQAEVEVDGESALIEVYARALLTVQLELKLNGEHLAGDHLT